MEENGPRIVKNMLKSEIVLCMKSSVRMRGDQDRRLQQLARCGSLRDANVMGRILDIVAGMGYQ